MKIQVNLFFTLSKIVAICILGLSSIYAFITKESNVLLFGISVSAAMFGWKSYNTTQRLKNGNGNNLEE